MRGKKKERKKEEKKELFDKAERSGKLIRMTCNETVDWLWAFMNNKNNNKKNKMKRKKKNSNISNNSCCRHS